MAKKVAANDTLGSVGENARGGGHREREMTEVIDDSEKVGTVSPLW